MRASPSPAYCSRQPRPTIVVLGMRSHRGRCPRLLERMGVRKRVDRHAGVDDALYGRIWREVNLEVARAGRLAGEANVSDGDLVTLAIAPGVRRDREIGLQSLQGLLVPV